MYQSRYPVKQMLSHIKTKREKSLNKLQAVFLKGEIISVTFRLPLTQSTLSDGVSK